MKVKMITRMAGPEGSYAPGDEADFESETAQALINGGYAEPAEGSSVLETDGDEDEPESNNSAGDGAVKPRRGKKKSED